MLIRVITIVVLAIMMSGCASLDFLRIKYVFVKPPAHTYSDVVVPKPVRIKTYLNAPDIVRENMCLDSIQDHQDAFYKLYISRQALNKWINDQELIYSSK